MRFRDKLSLVATTGQRLGDGFAKSKARVTMAVTVTVTVTAE